MQSYNFFFKFASDFCINKIKNLIKKEIVLRNRACFT